MSEKKEHPHAWVLREIADGAPLSDFEVKHENWPHIQWIPLMDHPPAQVDVLSGYTRWQVRRKQKMHRIGEHEFPAPMTEAPEYETWYWVANPYKAAHLFWQNKQPDHALLNTGVCHTTQEAAEAHSEALAAIARGEPV